MGCEEICYIALGAGVLVVLLILLISCAVACYMRRKRVARQERMTLIRNLLEQTNSSRTSSRRSSLAAPGAGRNYRAVSLLDLYTPPPTPPAEKRSGVT